MESVNQVAPVIGSIDEIDGLGDANYGGGKITNVRLKDGVNGPFRLFPPIHEGAKNGRWSSYHALHWGFKANRNGKTIAMPFECVQKTDRDTRKVTCVCEQCVVYQIRKSELETLVSTLKKEGKSSAQISALSKPLVEWLKTYNLDKKHVIFGMNEKQGFVKLMIPHKAKQALDVQIAKLTKRKIDPLKPSQGVWFTFTRTGNGIDTLHTVDVVMETSSDGMSEKIKMAPLTPAIVGRLLKEFPKDITKTVRQITPEQVRQLVATTTPEEVASVFDQGQPVGPSEGEEEDVPETMFEAKPSANANSTEVSDDAYLAMFNPKK